MHFEFYQKKTKIALIIIINSFFESSQKQFQGNTPPY